MLKKLLILQMMKASLNYKDIHPKFKLNGISYGFEGLKEVAYSLIKEGKEHEKHIGHFLSDWLDEKSGVAVKTSGSTGIPKTILLQKQYMVNSAIATGEFFGLQPEMQRAKKLRIFGNFILTTRRHVSSLKFPKCVLNMRLLTQLPASSSYLIWVVVMWMLLAAMEP